MSASPTTLSFALLLTSCCSPAWSHGLLDDPIAATKLQYLDSSASVTWVAATSGAAAPDGCSFMAAPGEQPLDGTPVLASGVLGDIGSRNACCKRCWAEALCAGSLYMHMPEVSACLLLAPPAEGHGAETMPAVDAAAQLMGTSRSRSTSWASWLRCQPRRSGPLLKLQIPATVPGDLLTDLQKAGQIGDPLYEKTFLNSSVWHAHTWTYTTSFTPSREAVAHACAAQHNLHGGGGRVGGDVGGDGGGDVGGDGGGGADVQGQGQAAGGSTAGRVLLVFDGIKMGARISVDGTDLGTAVDQFLRYTYDVTALVSRAASCGGGGRGEGATAAGGAATARALQLSVSFDPAIHVDGRFTACTGGWDWAPYSHTYLDGAHTFSKGLWKSVYLASSAPRSALITHVVPQIVYKGAYPTARLLDGAHGGFAVGVRVFFSAAAATTGQLALTTSWGAIAGTPISLAAGESNVTISAAADAADIQLWWPNGLGAQPLYNLTVSFTPDAPVGSGWGPSHGQGGSGKGSDAAAVSASRVVGFRYVALVTGNDTDPSYVTKAASAEGTSTHGMYLRVNGVVIYAKGANVNRPCPPSAHRARTRLLYTCHNSPAAPCPALRAPAPLEPSPSFLAQSSSLASPRPPLL